MPSSKQKRIGKPAEKEQVTILDTLHDTWKVMKPFVRFSIGALRVIAHTLIFIVKHIPKPEEQTSKPKRNKIIHIK